MPHSCEDKAREIRRRTNILLGMEMHDVISEMCREWQTADSDAFYGYMSKLGDEELRAAVESARKRLRKRSLVKKAAYEDVVIAYA